MEPCPPLVVPEVTQEAWDALTPTEQAALEDTWALSWSAEYVRCQARHDALIKHRKELGQ